MPIPKKIDDDKQYRVQLKERVELFGQVLDELETDLTHAVREILGEDAVGTITPHSFRHYFVTRVLRSSNNLKLAQELARHRNIAVTQRYAHLTNEELDKGFWRAIEEENKEE